MNNTGLKRFVKRCAPTLVCSLILFSAPAFSQTTESTHLRLMHPLDRPDVGYCVDVPGTSGFLRTDLPLFAHNCKPRLTSDSAVTFDSQGQIRFVELDLCITVAGINSEALPGAAVLLRKCGERSAFFETARLQRFTLTADGELKLSGSQLCLAVGPRSAPTYSSADSWRPFFVDDCQTVDSQRSRWEFVKPNE